MATPKPVLHVALLRGINVGGKKKVPMAALRALAEQLGWRRVATHVQSGNVVFAAAGRIPALETALEQAVEDRFGFQVPVIVRSASFWLRQAGGSPFRDAETARANLLHLGVSKEPAAPGAAKALAPYSTQGERIALRDGVIWIDYVGGVARSKVTPAVLDRAIGSTVTLRNWNSVQAIAALLRAAET